MKEELIEKIKEKAASVEPIGGIIKLKVDTVAICVDGTKETNEIILKDVEADCTVSTSFDTLEKLKSGKLNPMMAMMSGKIKVGGDMALAMKIKTLFS